MTYPSPVFKKAIGDRKERFIGSAYDPRHPGLRRAAMVRILNDAYAGLSWSVIYGLRRLDDWSR